MSHPWALVGSNDFIIDCISFSEMVKDFILVFVLYKKDGKVLAFFIGVHEKKAIVGFEPSQWPHILMASEMLGFFI